MATNIRALLFRVSVASLIVLVMGSQQYSASAQDGYGPLTFNSIDGVTGQLLPGGTFIGMTCTKFDGDPDWTCSSLNDYEWFRVGMTDPGSTFDFFETEIDMEGGFNEPVNQCVIVYEESGPEGYIADNSVLAVCKGPGGWTANHNIVVNGQPMSTGSWLPTVDANGDIVGWSLPHFRPIPPQPEAVTTYGDWSTEVATCQLRTVEQKRSVFLTEYVLDATNTWVLGQPVDTSVETRSITLTPEEAAACDAGSPSPVIEPSQEPATEVVPAETAVVSALPRTGSGQTSSVAMIVVGGLITVGLVAVSASEIRRRA